MLNIVIHAKFGIQSAHIKDIQILTIFTNYIQNTRCDTIADYLTSKKVMQLL